ncbi:MAG: cytochrome c [Acidobacteria bacterium]|nr:cytochrome c [Acidobacteriota bacterium]
MKQRAWLALVLLVVLIVGGAGYAASQASLSALSQPGAVETYLATAAKGWLVTRAARSPLPPAPPNDSASVASGYMQYGGRCAFCHGTDGTSPTDVGTSLYPRAVRLNSTAVQQYSDAELFVVIRDGIRLSGMPGFGRIYSDRELWNLVHYVRSLGPAPRSQPSQ